MKDIIGIILFGAILIAIMIISTIDGGHAMNKHLYNKCIQRNNILSVVDAEKQCAWIKEELK